MMSVSDSNAILRKLSKTVMKKPVVAKPTAAVRTLPTRPKKVVPKRDEFSESFCEIHDDENLLHDGDGGFYCYSCDNSVLCVGCESVIQREDIYYTSNAGTLQEEFYCDYCCGPDTDDDDEDDFMEVYSYHHGFGSFCGEHEHLQPYRDFRYYQCWGGGPEGGYIECGNELYRVNRTWGEPFTVERVEGTIEEKGDKIRIIKK